MALQVDNWLNLSRTMAESAFLLANVATPLHRCASKLVDSLDCLDSPEFRASMISRSSEAIRHPRIKGVLRYIEPKLISTWDLDISHRCPLIWWDKIDAVCST